MIRRFLLSLCMAALALAPVALADQPGFSDVSGVWYVGVSVDGFPDCQCIQILTFHPDGRLEGPPQDRTMSDVRGVWTQTTSGEFLLQFIFNNIDKDGNTTGITSVKQTLRLDSRDTGSGRFTFQILGKDGKQVFAGTGRSAGTRLRP